MKIVYATSGRLQDASVKKATDSLIMEILHDEGYTDIRTVELDAPGDPLLEVQKAAGEGTFVLIHAEDLQHIAALEKLLGDTPAHYLCTVDPQHVRPLLRAQSRILDYGIVVDDLLEALQQSRSALDGRSAALL